MLIELVDSKKLKEFEIGYLYKTKPEARALTANRIVQIKNITGSGEDTKIMYIYSKSGSGEFRRSIAQFRKDIIREPD